MTTAVSSLIADITDRLDNYGEASTTLTAAVTTTTATSFSIDDTSVLHKGDWVLVDNEMCEVTEDDSGTVRRGARGSTAATHLISSIVRVNPTFPNHRIFNSLQTTLGVAYPKLYKLVEDTTTLDIVSGQYTYAVPATIDRIMRLEIESENNSGVYLPIRTWELASKASVRIYDVNSWGAGGAIKLVGIAPFPALTLAGNLDADFPDTNYDAIEYLRLGAMARLLIDVQAQIAKRDSFKGLSDSFGAGQPFASISTAKAMLTEAETLLKKCAMPLPKRYLPDPNRAYLDKGE